MQDVINSGNGEGNVAGEGHRGSIIICLHIVLFLKSCSSNVTSPEMLSLTAPPHIGPSVTTQTAPSSTSAAALILSLFPTGALGWPILVH